MLTRFAFLLAFGLSVAACGGFTGDGGSALSGSHASPVGY